MVPAVRREHHRCVVIPAQAIGLGGRIGIPFPGLQARFILLTMPQSLSSSDTESSTMNGMFGVGSIDRAFRDCVRTASNH